MSQRHSTTPAQSLGCIWVHLVYLKRRFSAENFFAIFFKNFFAIFFSYFKKICKSEKTGRTKYTKYTKYTKKGAL